MSNQSVVRTLTVRGTSDGLDKVAADLTKVADAHGRAADASTRAASVTETSAKRQLSTANAWDRLRKSVDDTYAAEQRLARADVLGQRAIAQGRDVGEVGRILDLHRQKVLGLSPANENLARTTGLAAHQVTNLRSQLIDVGTSLSGGASPLMVLSQQGGQVYEALAGQGGMTAGLKAAGASALSIINPFTVAAAAVAAVGTGGALAFTSFANGQEELRRSLAGTGRLTDATVGGINRLAPAWAQAADISIGSAREMAGTFAATGKIQTATFGGLIEATKSYARATGTDLPDATKVMAQALADPVKGAEQLNERFAFLDGTTYRLIRTLDATGQRTAAQTALVAAMRPVLTDAAGATNAWSAAWDAVANAAKRAYDSTGQAIARATMPTPQQRLDTAQDRYREEVEAGPRRGLSQRQLDARDMRLSRQADELSYDQEDRRRQGALSMSQSRAAGAADISLQAAKIIEQMTPSDAEILLLTKRKTILEQTLTLGNAQTGTEDALKRINELIAAGGTQALELRKSAQDAFNQAPLLGYQRGLAQIEAKYRDLIVAANGNKEAIAGLNVSKGLDVGAFQREQIGNPLRDAATRVNEQVSGLRVLRDGFSASTEAAAAMAAKQDLVNQFARQGITDLSGYTKQIDAIAAASGKATAAQEELRRVQQNVVAGMDELRSSTQGGITGAFSDVRQGKNPLQGIVTALGRQTDQMFDRLVSKPLTEGLLGPLGKPGGGAGGDLVSRMFGDPSAIKIPGALAQAATTTASMTVNAGVVTLNGGLGAGGGLPGMPGPSQAAAAGPASVLASPFRSVPPAPLGAVPQVASMPNPGTEPLQVTVRPSPAAPFPTLPALPDVSTSPQHFDRLSRAVDQIRLPTDDAMTQRAFDGAITEKMLGIEQASQRASQSMSSLTDSASGAASGLGSFGTGLNQFGSQLSQANIGGSGGGFGGMLAGLFGKGSGGGSDALQLGDGAILSANGNVMTSHGPMALNRYEKGGIANSPQLSIFGEGRTPEAYVPLPDGRSIPVSMNVPMPANTNGGMASNVTINQAPINVTADSRFTPEQIAAEIQRANAETVKHIRRNFGSIAAEDDRRRGSGRR